MAAKTKINDHGDVIFSEQDAIDLLYTNPDFDISKLYFDDIDKYSKSLKELARKITTNGTCLRNTMP